MGFNEWEEVRLRDVVDILGDGLHGTPKYDNDGEYYFINGNNLNGKIVIDDKTKKVNYEQYLKYKKDLSDRTILVSINGTLGNVALYNEEKIILGKSACYFNVNKNVDKYFVMYVMKSNYFKQYTQNYATGTTIKNLGLKQMREFPFALPPIDEQKAIAHFLSTLDEKIEVNNQINKTLEDMAQAIFKHWFIDFEFPNEEGEPYKSSGGEMVESELGMIPKGWETGSISNMGDVVGGATPSKQNEEFYSEKGIPWITPKDLSNNKNLFISRGAIDISSEGFKSSSTKKMPRGTVLFSSRAPIGYIAMAKNEVTTNQGFKSIVPNLERGFTCEFVYCWLKENLSIIENRASGSTFKEISGTEMKKIEAVIPQKSALDIFRDTLSNVFGDIECKESENDLLKNIRDTLLPKLMSGEIKVPLGREGEAS